MKFLRKLWNSLFGKSSPTPVKEEPVIIAPQPEEQLPLPIEIPSENVGEIADFKFVDLSHHHPGFDVAKYAAVCKLFINKATQSISMIDSTYAKRQKLCKDAGIKYGGYHFWQCGVSWIAQWEHYARVHGEFVIPPILDFELSGGNTSAQLKVDLENAYLWMCKAEQVSGKTPILYIGYALAKELNLPAKWKRFLPWFPRYASALGAVPAPWSEEDMFAWQFTESGRFAGIEDLCDVNIYYGKNNRLNLN